MEPIEKMSQISASKVLITGVTGTIGRELLAQLIQRFPETIQIIGIDNTESEIFFLQSQYQEHLNVRLYVCDIRDLGSSESHFEGCQIVFHCAALKHVGICEVSPEQAVLTNIIGTQNIIKLAKKNGVRKVLFTSSDKAVNPTNVMGTTKLMGERLITAANLNSDKTIFSSTRFGNVLGSNGSVIPIFKKQMQQGQNLTVTHPEMTRFVMSKKQAVQLVLESAEMMVGGEVFVTKMPVMNINIIAQALIHSLAHSYGRRKEHYQIKYIGTKPGEKLYEELTSYEETSRSIELDDYYVVLPALRGFFQDYRYNYEYVISKHLSIPYNSKDQECLNLDETISTLHQYDLLEIPEAMTSSRLWPGDN